MRKASECSATKTRLLQSAQKLILRRGFAGTSVDEICKNANVTKGSFFHYFSSKEDLGFRLLEKYCGEAADAFSAFSCATQQKDPLKRIYKLIDFMIDKAREMGSCGCLLGGMSQELSEAHQSVRRLADETLQKLSCGIQKDLAEAKKKYAPRASFKPSELADYLLTLMQGGALISKVRRNPSAAISNYRHFKQYLKSIYGR